MNKMSMTAYSKLFFNNVKPDSLVNKDMGEIKAMAQMQEESTKNSRLNLTMLKSLYLIKGASKSKKDSNNRVNTQILNVTLIPPMTKIFIPGKVRV